MSGFAGMFAAGGLTSVVATGGQTIYDGTGTLAGYRFHAFTANGTFTVTSNDAGKTFDAVLVGGGGGAGAVATGAGGGAGGGAVTEVTGITLSTSTAYPIIVGSGGSQAPVPANPSIQISVSGSASTWNGYSAAGGIRAGGATAGGGQITGGASGNGNPGGAATTIGGGGGGAGGAGLAGTPGTAPNTPAPGDAPVPFWLNGGGGVGYLSTIDGNPYGAGGGGGPNFTPYPIYIANPNFANAYTPTATAFNPVTYSVNYGNEFVPGGGGLARSPGINGKGGGAGGQMGGPPAYNTQFYYGGSGRVTIRYPYITAPGEPTGVTAVGGNGQATITFTPPVADGGSSILDYTVTSSPGNITATGTGSPITITGLTNGTTYTFRVKARNGTGSSLDSGASNGVIPGVASNPASVIATGGQTIYDGTGAFTGYRFHVFTSNSNFTLINNPTNKTFSVLIVGGGGGSGDAGTIGSARVGGGGGAVLEVPTLSLTTNTSYAVIVGTGGVSGLPTSPINTNLEMKPGNVSIFYGYKAVGGVAGTSGNGNVGGSSSNPSVGNSVSGGGGGAGSIGNNGRAWTTGPLPGLPIPPVYPPIFAASGYPTPYETYWRTGSYVGGGGSGYTSTIDGNSYGAGGSGGAIVDAAGAVPSTAWNGKYTPETDPTGTSFIPGGGGSFATPGVNGKGGGGAGTSGGPPALSGNNFFNGGSGTVVIRYPYP